MAAYPQSSFLGGVFAPALYGRTDLARYPHALRELRNFIVKQEGSAINRPGTKDLAAIASAARLVPFVFSRDKSYVLVFTNLNIAIYKAGVFQVNVTAPWATADLPYLKVTQSGSVMTICRDGFDQRELTWSGDASWALTTISFASTMNAPTGVTVQADVIAADAAHPVKDWQWQITAVGTGEAPDESLPASSAVVSRVLYSDRPVKITWTAPGGGPAVGFYNVYRGRNGKFGYVGSTTNTNFWDDGIYPVYSDPPPTNRNPFSAAGWKPQVVSYHQQRIVYANAFNDPPGIWSSQLGLFHNFNTGSPPKDTDPVTMGVASRKFEEVRALVTLGGDLVVMTNATERVIQSEQGFSPNSINDVPVSYWGSAWLDPLLIGNNLLFVQEKGTSVRDMTAGGGSIAPGDDLTLLAQHLFDGLTVTDWCYQEVPFRAVWAVRSDGKLLSLTYVKQNNLAAWAWHDSAATFENVCCVPEGTEDVVYLVANLAGSRRLVRLATRKFATLADATLLDLHVTYSGGPTTTITGLAHLNGRTDVYALADGIVRGPFTVSGGQITLPVAASKVCAGLRYTSELETLDLANPQQDVQSMEKQVRKVFLKVTDSQTFQVGDTLTDSLVVAPMPAADANGFAQGLVEVLPNSTWNRNGRACIRQQDPLPVNILSVIREVEVGGV